MAPLRLTTLLAVLLALLVPASLWGSGPASDEVEVRFVPVGASGTVSLGIYDAEGRLVRVLCDEWTFNRFRIGLNGLSTGWDGRSTSGEPVPAGTYTARGYIVGDIGVAGEAIHFNDWIDSPDSPRIVTVTGQQLLPGGDILLSARIAGATGALVRYSPESEARWRTVVSEARPKAAVDAQLAVSDTLAFVVLDGHLRAAGLEDGAEIALSIPHEDIRLVAARGDRLAVYDGQVLRFYRLPGFTPESETSEVPGDLVSLALLGEGAVAAEAGGVVWRWDGEWSRVPWPPEARVLRVAGGRGQTIWALEEQEGGEFLVVQFSDEEGRLAEWRPGAGERPVALSGAFDRDYFVVTLDAPAAQRTAAIRRQASGEGWEYVFDKKIIRCGDFGWADGQLVPDASDRPDSLKVRLAENPLEPSGKQNLVLRAVADESGTGLATKDGLPLLRVSSSPSAGVMIVPGDALATARFFQGDGACVEEYALSNLGDILAFNAGTIEMAAGREAEPPPPEEPEEESEEQP